MTVFVRCALHSVLLRELNEPDVIAIPQCGVGASDTPGKARVSFSREIQRRGKGQCLTAACRHRRRIGGERWWPEIVRHSGCIVKKSIPRPLCRPISSIRARLIRAPRQMSLVFVGHDGDASIARTNPWARKNVVGCDVRSL